MDDFLIGGVSAAMLIVLLLQLCKTYGLSGKLVPIIAAILGITFSVLSALAEVYPDLAWGIRITVTGLILGLSAIGFHSATTYYQQRAEERDLKEAAQEQQATIVATATATPDTVRKEVEVQPVGTQGTP